MTWSLYYSTFLMSSCSFFQLILSSFQKYGPIIPVTVVILILGRDGHPSNIMPRPSSTPRPPTSIHPALRPLPTQRSLVPLTSHVLGCLATSCLSFSFSGTNINSWCDDIVDAAVGCMYKTKHALHTYQYLQVSKPQIYPTLLHQFYANTLLLIFQQIKITEFDRQAFRIKAEG